MTGLGDKFGGSLTDDNTILDDLNPRLPQLRRDVSRWPTSVTCSRGRAGPVRRTRRRGAQCRDVQRRTQEHRRGPDVGVGFSDTGADIIERGERHLERGAQDLLPTSKLLDDTTAG